MKNIKCVLLDMDGVMLDSEKGAFELLGKTLSTMGVQLPIEELLKFVGRSSLDIASELIETYQLHMTIEEFQMENRKTGNYYVDSETLKPTKDLREFLEYLKLRKIWTAVVSSTRSGNVLTVLNRMQMLKYFDVVICGDMLTEVKPAPEGYLEAAKLLGVKPESCIVIEDSPIGICAGKHAGMFVVAYKGMETKQDTAMADIEINSFRELMNLERLEMQL